jgi:hypothetical protein
MKKNHTYPHESKIREVVSIKWTESQNILFIALMSSVLSLPRVTGISKRAVFYRMKSFKSSNNIKSVGFVLLMIYILKRSIYSKRLEIPRCVLSKSYIKAAYVLLVSLWPFS